MGSGVCRWLFCTVWGMTRLTIGRRGLRVLAGVVVCCVVVSGCTDGAGQSGEAAESGGSDSSSGASSGAAVEMSGGYVVDARGRLVQPERSWPDLVVDPVMDEESVEGVEAFARYFVAVAERAWNTGDTAELERISSPECTYCTNLGSLIRQKYGDGYWVDGLRYQIDTVDEPIAFPHEELKFAVFVYLRTSALGIYDGQKPKKIEPKAEQLELQICRIPERWIACEGIGGNDQQSG